ncbi:hypothetical protein EDC02_5132 [Micromonospora sp. Llam0]|nr:hypothetical protein EDC02_5132 [Micromonospora sp. Llam0]
MDRRAELQAKRYVVALADHTLMLICADRHRRFDERDVFEVCDQAQVGVACSVWRQVLELPRRDVVRIERFWVQMPGTDAGDANYRRPPR